MMHVPIALHRALQAVKKHAHERPAEEVCGIIIDGQVVRSQNVVEGFSTMPDGSQRQRSPQTDFALDRERFEQWQEAIAAGKTAVVYHSHVGLERDFTAADATGMFATRCPWLLIHTPSDSFQYFDVNVKQKYEGREWHWSYSNCSTLVKDWLKREMDFDLICPILEEDQAWENPGWNFVVEGCDRQLDKVPKGEPLRRGDIIVMRMGDTANPNHMAIMTSLEKNEILHQLTGMTSVRKPYSSAYRKATFAVYRVPNAN